MWSTILVATDGSEHACSAVRAAVSLAEATHAKLIALHVFDTTYPAATELGAWEWAVGQGAFARMVDAEKERVETATLPLLQPLQGNWEMHHEMGHPVQVTLGAAVHYNADLLVAGSRGMNAWQAILVGSVADGLMHQSNRPVLIVRGSDAPLQKILAAADGSAGAQRAVEIAAGLAAAAGSGLTALNVVQLPHTPRTPPDDHTLYNYAEKMKHSVEQSLKTAAEASQIAISVVQRQGNTAHEIVQYARDSNASLIVVGNRGLGPFRSLLVGSVSDSVAHHAHCSVLIAR